MLIDVRSPRFELTPAILMHVERRLETALGVGRRLVTRVAVTVDDLNAADRGGMDKLCRVVAHCRGGGTLVAEARHDDLYTAIDHAAEKARREVLRRVERATRTQRLHRQRPGALTPA